MSETRSAREHRSPNLEKGAVVFTTTLSLLQGCFENASEQGDNEVGTDETELVERVVNENIVRSEKEYDKTKRDISVDFSGAEIYSSDSLNDRLETGPTMKWAREGSGDFEPHGEYSELGEGRITIVRIVATQGETQNPGSPEDVQDNEINYRFSIYEDTKPEKSDNVDTKRSEVESQTRSGSIKKLVENTIAYELGEPSLEKSLKDNNPYLVDSDGESVALKNTNSGEIEKAYAGLRTIESIDINIESIEENDNGKWEVVGQVETKRTQEQRNE